MSLAWACERRAGLGQPCLGPPSSPVASWAGLLGQPLPSRAHVPGSRPPAGLEFERWLKATGPPLAEPDLSQGSSLTRPVEALFQLWTAEPLDQAAASASAIDISKWRTFQTALFLDRLLDGSPLPQGGSQGCWGGGGGCLPGPDLPAAPQSW